MPETNRIEYKRELTPEVDIEKEVIAFLNYPEGGLIYVGMDAKGKPVSVPHADSDMLKLKDRIKNNIAPSAMGLFDVVLEQHKGKDIIKVIVASGNEKPYFKKRYGMTEKGCFIRVGTASEPMQKVQIEKLFAARTRNKELMRVFKDLQLVEQLGSGIPRILESYNKRCFKFSDNFLRMVLPIANTGLGISNTVHQTGGAIGGAITGLTDRQIEVLKLIMENPKIGYRTVAEKLAINPSAAQGHFDALREKRIIERKGNTRGYWKILIKL